MEIYTLILFWVLGILAVTTISAFLGKRYGVEFLIATVAALIVAANAVANKIVAIGPFTVTASVVAYSMVFLVSDLITERWGKETAHKAIWAGFYGVVLFVVVSQVALYWPAAGFALEQAESFESLFGTTLRVAAGSMIAYLLSQHYDVFAYTYLKKLTGNRFLWLRNNVSTISSQLLSTVVFITIAFYGVLPVLPLIIGQWCIKTVIAIIDTPFLYLMHYVVDNTKTKV